MTDAAYQRTEESMSNDCPWCHGTDTQFCNNPECRPTQPQQPAQYVEHQGNACLGVFVCLAIELTAGILVVIIINIIRLI